MSYQVLARKYRPASFQVLEGQEHVLQALVNALDNERLHHAYLFTGTRGVGKTTIARILARCLNCETGVTSTPCGTCSTCVEITEGRSVDLIEVDAASRTGVDDMRDLLENVQYMPSVSRFKIYLIDEVHMLSRSSFNAMLKTLEEPPEHVKFLFATTDPKKLPITVLSRCLQFNLKNLSPEQIVRYLGQVLDKESIAYDEEALWQLGHAADGSMRDALSLTDQAISFGNNEVRDEPVSTMLGSIDRQVVFELLDHIGTGNGAAMLETVAKLSDFAPDYAALLDDVLSVLHRVAIAHAVADAVDNAQGDRDLILATAKEIPAEQVQLFYQIGLIGQRDLPLAPMPRVGFEMVLLRMMAFNPSSVAGSESPPADRKAIQQNAPGGAGTSPISELMSAINGSSAKNDESDVLAEDVLAEKVSVEKVQTEKSPTEIVPTEYAEAVEKKAEVPPTPVSEVREEELVEEQEAEQVADEPVEPEAAPVEEPVAASQAPDLEVANWARILELLDLSGVTRSLAANCQLDTVEGQTCQLILAEHHASLWNAVHEKRIATGLASLYGSDVKVVIEVGETNVETPAQQEARERQDEMAKAVEEIQNDEHVQQLIENFNGRIDPDSISPLRQAEP